MTICVSRSSRAFRLLSLIFAISAASAGKALAISDQFNDAAAERTARKSAAREGRLDLPLPGTPDTDNLLGRLDAMGLSLGSPVLIRIFKSESELEIWMRKDGTYVRFATYPICYWSGALGPKLREGDRQTPEGFYVITADQLHHGNRWPRSLDIGYPNTFDRSLGRDGSHILVHGGCNSVGCFAMTNAVNAEVYTLVSAALQAAVHSEHAVPVHVFPFRMNEENIAAYAVDRWQDFWSNLKEGYDSFARTHLPPRISVCGQKYRVEDTLPGQDDDDDQPAPGCEGILVAAAEGGRAASAAPAAMPVAVSDARPVTSGRVRPSLAIRCSMSRASCRRWVALRSNRKAQKVADSRSSSRGRSGKRSRMR